MERSQVDRCEAFGVGPPGEPASAAAILLSIIVILPEAIAMVVLVMSTGRWACRSYITLFLVLLPGLTSTPSIISLATGQVSGDRWRGATMREHVAVEVGVSMAADRTGAVDLRRITGFPIFRTRQGLSYGGWASAPGSSPAFPRVRRQAAKAGAPATAAAALAAVVGR